MCALEAAGFDAGTSGVAVHPLRAEVRDEMQRLQGPATEAIRKFYSDHQLADPGETLSRFISYALVAGPPPKFGYLLGRDLLPPDVLALEGFDELLVNFYREAELDRVWSKLGPGYNREIGRFESPVRQIVVVSNGYLREILKPSSPRTFTVIVEPLVGGRINFRNNGDHYSVVVGGGAELPLDDIRHAYLHFLLDLLPLRYRKVVETRRPLLDFAARAPRLPAEYQKDFVALMTECFVKAVELRLRRLPAAQLEAALIENDRSGYVLVRPLVAQLLKFEKSEPAMRFYFPELVRGIDLGTEKARLQKIEFAAAEAPATETPEAGGAPEVSELDRWLAEGDQHIALQDAPAAAATFERVLAKYPEVPRAIYGLAVASVLQGNAERAKDLFEHLVAAPATAETGQDPTTAPRDPGILAWSHVYLGRIHDVEGDRELALSEYRAALAVEGAPESARTAAQRGVETGRKPPPKGGGADSQKP